MVASFFIAFITTMVPRFRPPPDVRDAHAHGSRVSCLLCFQRRPARDSTMEHGATSTIDGDLAVEKTAQLEWWWSPTLFFFCRFIRFPPRTSCKQATHGQRQEWRRSGCPLFFFSVLVWGPAASTMDSGGRGIGEGAFGFRLALSVLAAAMKACLIPKTFIFIELYY